MVFRCRFIMAEEELPEGWVEIEEAECDENGDPLPPRAAKEPQPEASESDDPEIVPPPAPAAAAPGQPKKEKEKPEHDDGDIPWEVPDVEAYTLEARARVTFDRIRFDETATEGQARVLDPELVKKRHRELLTNPPHEPVQPILWQESAAGKYVPLTLQHTCRALMLRRSELQGKQELPGYLECVKGTVLRSDTPLAIRQLIAGNDQNKQETANPFKLSRFLEIFMEDKDTKTEHQRMISAIQRAGYGRPLTKVCLPAFVHNDINLFTAANKFLCVLDYGCYTLQCHW